MKALRVLFKGITNTPVLLISGLGAVGAVATIAQVVLLAGILDEIIFRGSSFTQILEKMTLAIFATVIRALVLAWRERLSSDFAIQAVSNFRMQITTNALNQQNPITPAKVLGLLDALGKLEGFFARVVPSMVLMVVIPSIILVFMAWFDWLTALIFGLTAPLIPLLMWLIGSAAKEHTERQYQQMQHLGAHFMDLLRGLEDLQAMNRTKQQRIGIQKASDGFANTTMNVLQIAFLNGFAMELIATIATALVAVSSGVRLLQGDLSFSVALCSIVLAPEFFAPIRQFGLEHHTAMEAEPIAQEVLKTIKTPVLRQTVTPSQGGMLELKAVSFTYPTATQAALDKITLSFKPHSLTAIIGRSGSGKSTLLKVLLGLLEPSSGVVLLDGQPILSRAGLFAFVSQEPHLWNDTLLENLRFAKPEATESELAQALELAGASDFVAALPQGLSTPIGERGLRLSGGERQRIALARAFLQDAPFVVVDEATSSLDTFTQAKIETALQHLAKSRTVLMVAHRLEMVRHATQIVVLEAGQVLESGTHQTLLAKNGLYSKQIRVSQ